MRYLAWLCELPMCNGDPWRERVEISQEDARRLDIEDGDESSCNHRWPRSRCGRRFAPTSGRACWACLWGPDQAVHPALPSAASSLVSVADATSGHCFACATRAQVRKGASKPPQSHHSSRGLDLGVALTAGVALTRAVKATGSAPTPAATPAKRATPLRHGHRSRPVHALPGLRGGLRGGEQRATARCRSARRSRDPFTGWTC